MNIVSKKAIAAFVAGAFILAGAAVPFTVQAAEKKDNKPGHQQRYVDSAKVADRIANTYGVSKLSLLKYHTDGTSFRDLTRASFLAAASGKSLDDVMALKTADKNWKSVAESLGVTKEQIKVTKNTVFANRLQYKFGIDKTVTASLLKEGYKPRQIAMAGLLAKDANKPIGEIIKMKTDNNKWSDVAKTLGVDEKAFKKETRQVKHFFAQKKAHNNNVQKQ